MNKKQKLWYMALGAVIMVVGMGIGTIVSPNLTAQSDGEWNHFNHVTCRSLTVADENGLIGVELVAGIGDHRANGIRVFDKSGESVGALLWTDVGGSMLAISNQPETLGILMASNEERNTIEIYNPSQHHTGIKVGCTESISKISLDGQVGEEGIILATSAKIDPFIAITNRAGKVKARLD